VTLSSIIYTFIKCFPLPTVFIEVVSYLLKVGMKSRHVEGVKYKSAEF